MAKCPHCGEPVGAGQERCFACGQSVRSRQWRARQTMNPLVFVLAGVLALVAVAAIVIVSAGAGKRRAALQARQELERVQDSVRKANRQAFDLAREQGRDEAVQGAAAQLAEIEARYSEVKARVAKGQPSQQQQYIINQFAAELARLRALVRSADGAAPDKRAAIQNDLRDGQRKLRSFISDLARAPQNK
jgi:type II secretory pathway pseudopilin PulG